MAERYGALPVDLGMIDLSPTEMMFWLYCPVSRPGNLGVALPPNLLQFLPLIRAVRDDDRRRFTARYVYLTAKTLWVEGTSVGNRHGWHTDGFGTDDVNYLWYDRDPTHFLEDDFALPDDCTDAMAEMDRRASCWEARHWVMPVKHLLRLDSRVVHRTPPNVEPGMRTFVKVSLSAEPYNLIGNSINHRLPLAVAMHPRKLDRNHPNCKDYV